MRTPHHLRTATARERPAGRAIEKWRHVSSVLDRKSTRLNSSPTEIYTFPYTTLFRSGIGLISQITIESLEHIRRADRLFYLLTNRAAEKWIRGLNANATSLEDCYGEGKARWKSYREMAARIVGARSEEHTSELQSHRDLHLSLHDALPIWNRSNQPDHD